MKTQLVIYYSILRKVVRVAKKCNLTRQYTVCRKGYNQRFIEIFSNGAPRRSQRSEKKFQKRLIIVFEIIMQLHKTHFLTLSSETKIMKITYSGESNSPHTLKSHQPGFVLETKRWTPNDVSTEDDLRNIRGSASAILLPAAALWQYYMAQPPPWSSAAAAARLTFLH